MSLLLDAARMAALANIILLLGLAYVWLGAYRRHRASHTLGLLVFATFLLVQNGLWLYLYVLHEQFIHWFGEGDTVYRVGVMALCGLQTVALVALAAITWR